MIFEGTTSEEVYWDLLHHLVVNPNPHAVRGLTMHGEIIGVTVVIHDANTNEITIPGRNFRAYSYCEALWNLSNTAEVSILREFNKNIDRFVNDQPENFRDEAIWAYGPVMVREIPKIVQMLKKDPQSRRAIITMPRDLKAIGTHPCLSSIQFLIRNYALHAVVTMRSNDIWLGFPIDIFQFTLIQCVIAGALFLPLGSYTHNVGSLHMYTGDVEAAEKLLSSREPNGTRKMYPLQFNAWDEVGNGTLLKELKSIVHSKPSESSAFHFYLNVLHKEWFRKNCDGNQ